VLSLSFIGKRKSPRRSGGIIDESLITADGFVHCKVTAKELRVADERTEVK